MHRHTYVARDYMAELNQWAHEDYFFGNVHKMQLPFTAVSGTVECRIVLTVQSPRRNIQVHISLMLYYYA